VQPYDLAIIGGGINGAGIARDAAGRGLCVLLVEQHDLASATSSASTKLIHGGLRYLEYFEFRLVSEALEEREALLGIAPHIVWPQQFILPHEKHLRPAWMIRSGLFLYDHLGRGAFALRGGRSSLPRSRRVPLHQDAFGAGLKPEFDNGFSYYDCWVDDARLVVLNARAAKAHGARILTRTRLTNAHRARQTPPAAASSDAAGTWTLTLEGIDGHEVQQVSARVLINAAGPWVQRVLEHEIGMASPGKVRLVKGSHIVVPRLHAKSHAFILQNPDRRIIFMIPYEREFTLIGTTDVPLPPSSDNGPDGGFVHPTASAEEVAYLCESASRYSATAITPGHVVWSYSGVRALYDDGSQNPSAVTRDYHLLLDTGSEPGDAPLLSVFGGKITTYRRLAEAALENLQRWFPGTRPWTLTEALPGGDFHGRSFTTMLEDLQRRYSGLPPLLVARLMRRHGTLAETILGNAKSEKDLGENFGGGLYEVELRYLLANEWARAADDVLWRRTKCGLHMNEAERRHLDEVLPAMLQSVACNTG